VHAEVFEGAPAVAYETTLPVETDKPTRHFQKLNMYFGGVQAAAWSPASGLIASADPRRSGDVSTGGHHP
jgi:gamma-glutamyltranspeptidase/glutathione hydrolase